MVPPVVLVGALGRDGCEGMTQTAKGWLGLAFTLLVFFAFQLFWYNRFLPIQDGWLIEYGQQINSGRTIYKDFFVFIQPLYAWIFAGVGRWFGYDFINFRYYGLVERAALVGTVYLVFLQITTPYRAIFLSLLGLYFFSSNTADVVYSYYQLTAVFCFGAAYLLIRHYRTKGHLSAIAAGVLCGLAFMTKQSTGALVPLALAASLLFVGHAERRNLPNLLKPPILFSAGVLIPIMLIMGYIAAKGASSEYWRQVFVGASSSKGAIGHILFAFWGRMLPLQYVATLAAAAVVLLAFSWWHARRTRGHEPRRAMPGFLLLGLIVIALAGVSPWLISYPETFSRVNEWYLAVDFYETKNKLTFVAFYFNAMLVAYYAAKAVVRKLDSEKVPVALLAVASFAFMYSHGLSFRLEPHAAVISAGLLAYMLLSVSMPFGRLKNAVVYGAVAFVVFMSAFEKSAWPYSWWGWDERIVWTANTEPTTALLHGFRLNADKAAIIDGINQAIQEHSRAGDPIYTFPHMPMFYLTAHRRRVTFSAVHYFDVMPDDIARNDASVVAETKPPVIVVMEFPDDAWTFHEKQFRAGRPSGQRQIMEVIDGFRKSGEYTVVRSYVTSGYNFKLYVMARNRAP